LKITEGWLLNLIPIKVVLRVLGKKKKLCKPYFLSSLFFYGAMDFWVDFFGVYLAAFG
jgi:hypothetical protein